MKLDLYMYDRPIELNEKTTTEFIGMYMAAKETMKELLDLFPDDEDTRKAIFFMLGLRTLIDDFLEFCTDGISADLIERLLNGDNEAEEEIFNIKEDLIDALTNEEDDGEILVEFDDDEEEE